MLSMRALSRSAPRAAARLTSSSAVLRSAAWARPAVATRTATAAALAVSRTSVSAFSSMAARCAPAKTGIEEELSAKLASEIQFENEIREDEPESTTVKDFVDSGLYEIEDVAGREEVVLRRTYKDEKITITFSVADLTNYDPEMYDDDGALGDEEAEAKAEEQEEQAEEDAEEDGDADSGAVPCRLSIVVEKPGKAGALSVEATAQEGAIVVDNLYYYADAALAHEASAESAHAAQRVYPGPAFGTLDEDLQVLLDRYLEERGISTSLAVFVPEYLDLKEQREYLGFLNNLKGFVDA